MYLTTKVTAVQVVIDQGVLTVVWRKGLTLDCFSGSSARIVATCFHGNLVEVSLCLVKAAESVCVCVCVA